MDDKNMPLWQHLEELRWTLFRVIVAVSIASALSFIVIDRLFYLFMQPLSALATGNQVVLNLAGPFDGIIIRMKTALMSGFVLATPFNLIFLYSFISPGLAGHERKALWWVCGAGTVLFLCGTVLGFLALSQVLPLLAGFTVEGAVNIWTLKTYFDFLFFWIIGSGIVFELPLIIVVLVRNGILEVEDLRRSRHFAVLVIFVVAAVCTPPDPFTQLLMAVPMYLLYELGILIANAWKRD